VVSVPEGFKALIPHINLGSGIHQKHNQEKDVTGCASPSLVVNLPGIERKDIKIFNIKKVDIMGGHMDAGEEKHAIGGNLMEPNIFIKRDEVVEERGTNHTNEVAAHRKENHGAIKSKDATSTTRGPYGKFQAVQERQVLVILLLEKPIDKQENVETTVEYKEGNSSRGVGRLHDKRSVTDQTRMRPTIASYWITLRSLEKAVGTCRLVKNCEKRGAWRNKKKRSERV